MFPTSVTEILERFPFPVALGVVKDGAIFTSENAENTSINSGISEIRKNPETNEVERSLSRIIYTSGSKNDRFWWASNTKPIFAYSVLVAAKEGYLKITDSVKNLLDVEIIAPNYAKNNQTQQKGEQAGFLLGSEKKMNTLANTDFTVAHLLAHASGLPQQQKVEVGIAGVAENENAVEKNARQKVYLQTFPESRRIYSNYGYQLLGICIEASTGMSAEEWIHHSVLEPLQMNITSLDYSEDRSVAKDLQGPIMDLLKFAQELLEPKLLTDELAKEFHISYLPNLNGVVPGFGLQKPCPWGIGVEIRGHKSPHWMAPKASENTFGHFGMGGSFLWVDPDLRIGSVFLSGEIFSDTHKILWPHINQAILDWVKHYH